METAKENLNNTVTLRPLHCQMGPLSRCDGSAQLNQGGTTIICGTYGPAEIRPHKEMIEKATIEVSIIPKIGRPGVEDRAKESLLTQIISASVLASLHPRNGLHIGLQGMLNERCNIWKYPKKILNRSLIITYSYMIYHFQFLRTKEVTFLVQ